MAIEHTFNVLDILLYPASIVLDILLYPASTIGTTMGGSEGNIFKKKVLR